METVSPIQRDAFKELIHTFAQDLLNTQTFADELKQALENKVDVIADELAEKAIGHIVDNVDCDEAVREAVSTVETALEDHCNDAVQNISF